MAERLNKKGGAVIYSLNMAMHISSKKSHALEGIEDENVVSRASDHIGLGRSEVEVKFRSTPCKVLNSVCTVAYAA